MKSFYFELNTRKITNKNYCLSIDYLKEVSITPGSLDLCGLVEQKQIAYRHQVFLFLTNNEQSNTSQGVQINCLLMPSYATLSHKEEFKIYRHPVPVDINRSKLQLIVKAYLVCQLIIDPKKEETKSHIKILVIQLQSKVLICNMSSYDQNLQIL